MQCQHIFITGASSGIGEALAVLYAKNGVTLGLLSTDSSRTLEEVAERCRAKGANVITYNADVAEKNRIDECAIDFQTRVGNTHLVIANAGVAYVEDNEYVETDIPMKNMRVNYFGVINTLLPFVEHMKKNRSGQIAIISSISSLRSTHNSGAYSASKAAINLWSEGLRLRLRPYNIPVTTLCVGFVDTAMTKNNPFWMPGLISADKAAILISNAILKKKRQVVLPWQSGGLWTIFHLMPGTLYDWLIDWAKNRTHSK
jgi:short-subunit dehydrogenase